MPGVEVITPDIPAFVPVSPVFIVVIFIAPELPFVPLPVPLPPFAVILLQTIPPEEPLLIIVTEPALPPALLFLFALVPEVVISKDIFKEPPAVILTSPPFAPGPVLPPALDGVPAVVVIAEPILISEKAERVRLLPGRPPLATRSAGVKLIPADVVIDPPVEVIDKV